MALLDETSTSDPSNVAALKESIDWNEVDRILNESLWYLLNAEIIELFYYIASHTL